MMMLFRLLLIMVFLFMGNTRFYAHDAIDREISLIYHNHTEKNIFTENDFHFLQSIKEADLSQSPDSVIYRYHFLMGGWLHMTDGDLQSRIYHVGKALHLIETRPDVTQFGIFNIEYLWLSNALAGYYKEQGNIDKAIFQYERTLVRGERLLEGEANKNTRRVKSGCLASLGDLYIEKGYEREAVDCLEKAFELASVDYELDDTEGYYPLFRLAYYYGHKKKDYAKSITQWKRLIDFFEKHGAGISKENANMHYFLGSFYAKSKDYQRAIEAYKKGIDIYREVKVEASEMESIYSNLMLTYAKCGDVEGVKAVKDNLYKIYISQNNEKDYYINLCAATMQLPPDKAKPFSDEFSQVFSQLGITEQVKLLEYFARENIENNPQRSISYSKQAIDIISTSEYKDSSPGWLYSLTTIQSFAHEQHGDLNEAVIDAELSLKYLAECRNASDSIRQQTLHRIVDLYFDAKKYDKVVETANVLLPLTEQLYGMQNPKYISIMALRGIGLMYDNKCKEAIAAFKKNVTLIKQVEGEHNIVYAINIHNLGRAYMLKGDTKNAIKYLEEAKALQLAIDGTIDKKTNQYLNELGIYE